MCLTGSGRSVVPSTRGVRQGFARLLAECALTDLHEAEVRLTIEFATRIRCRVAGAPTARVLIVASVMVHARIRAR